MIDNKPITGAMQQPTSTPNSPKLNILNNFPPLTEPIELMREILYQNECMLSQNR
jgi:hypothetical protein